MFLFVGYNQSGSSSSRDPLMSKSKPQGIKRKQPGHSTDLSSKTRGSTLEQPRNVTSPRPSTSGSNKDSPLKREVPTRQLPRKHRGGC